MYLLRYLLLILLISYTFCSSAQKKYNVEIIFGNEINLEKLHLYVDNGRQQNRIQFSPSGDTVRLSGIYFGKYAVLVLKYEKNEHWSYQKMFFIKEKNAQIIFNTVAAETSPFENYTLIHAFDLKRQIRRMKQFDAEQINKLKRFMGKYGDKIFNGTDTTLSNNFSRLNKALFQRDVQYIKKHGDDYYAFLYFRRNIVSSHFINPDSALHIFQTAFPDSFKNSPEGNTVLQILKGRVNVGELKIAPDFVTKDIYGNKIVLKQLLDKGFVLLSFWAPWCVPCIHELPELKNIKERYANSDLSIVSVSYPGSYKRYRELINTYEMSWINIYNNDILIQAWGSGPIPRLYLIAPSGEIIFYNRNFLKESPMDVLRDLLHEKLE